MKTILILVLALCGCAPQPNCVSFSDKAVGEIKPPKDFVLTAFDRGYIKGVPRGWYDKYSGCCTDDLMYIILKYPERYGFFKLRKRNFNEARIQADWITCKEYEGSNSYWWPPKITISRSKFFRDKKGVLKWLGEKTETLRLELPGFVILENKDLT